MGRRILLAANQRERRGGGVSAGENRVFGHKKPEVTLAAAVSALRR